MQEELKEILPSIESKQPRIIDEEGNPIVGPEMEAVTRLIVEFAQLAQLARIRKAVESVRYSGQLVPFVLPCTESTRDFQATPGPWINAFFINRGPNTAYIAINNAVNWIEIRVNETRTINRAHADKRIEYIYHRCDPGNIALVMVEGEY